MTSIRDTSKYKHIRKPTEIRKKIRKNAAGRLHQKSINIPSSTIQRIRDLTTTSVIVSFSHSLSCVAEDERTSPGGGSADPEVDHHRRVDVEG